jgi:hypothetical protein
VLTSNHAVRLTSRTYAATAAGTYGQGIPVHGAAHVLRYGDVGRLVQLAENDQFRTNIGFVNTGSLVTDIELELYDDNGQLLRTRSITLQAGEHHQINGVFQQTVDVGWARVWTSTPGGEILAYGSLLDNQADDPTFIYVQ